ncbi:hypothetical protein D3C86_1204370 [compost metagenome]
MDGGVAEDPDQPGEDQRADEAEQLDADLMAFSFGERDQRHAPDPQTEFNERQPYQQMREGVEEAFQALGIQRMALHTALRFERVAADEAVDDHAQHQQHGADQRLTQCSAGIAGGNERGEQ